MNKDRVDPKYQHLAKEIEELLNANGFDFEIDDMHDIIETKSGDYNSIPMIKMFRRFEENNNE